MRTTQAPAAEGVSAPAFSLRRVRQVREGVDVLPGLDLEIPDGRITAVLGPSGAGKTSLLRLLDRLDEPAAGEVCYRGRPLGDYPVRELRRRVGFVFQTPVMFPGTVADNLRTAARLSGRDRDGMAERTIEVLSLAELDPELAGRPGERLSVGERQRANIARALITGPEALLMDEPTSALDPETADRLLETVRHLNERLGLTVVIVTHRLDEARRLADHAVVLKAGRLIEAGDVERLFREPREPWARAFLGRNGGQ
jgi:ABC-type methionine transport system ATPase subunit